MSKQNKFRQNLGFSQEEPDSNGSLENQKRLIASTADFYTEWTSEKTSIVKPKSGSFENSIELSSGREYQSQNKPNKYRPVSGNADAYGSTCYNEIHNRPDLFVFPRT